MIIGTNTKRDHQHTIRTPFFQSSSSSSSSSSSDITLYNNLSDIPLIPSSSGSPPPPSPASHSSKFLLTSAFLPLLKRSSNSSTHSSSTESTPSSSPSSCSPIVAVPDVDWSTEVEEEDLDAALVRRLLRVQEVEEEAKLVTKEESGQDLNIMIDDEDVEFDFVDVFEEEEAVRHGDKEEDEDIWELL
jgi:hypothetical protein